LKCREQLTFSFETKNKLCRVVEMIDHIFLFQHFIEMHFRERTVFGCDLDINMVCGAQLKSDNSNEEDLAGCQRGGVARTEKSQSHPPMQGLLHAGCVRQRLSLFLWRRFSSPKRERGVAFPRFSLSTIYTLLKKFLLKAPICICALCMQRGQISFLALRVAAARVHALMLSAERRIFIYAKSRAAAAASSKRRCAQCCFTLHT
jgi:hypothetical protein